MLTENSVRQFTEHIAGQGHAMAGATIAASGALAWGLGEACVRISRSRLEAAGEQAAAQRVAARSPRSAANSKSWWTRMAPRSRASRRCGMPEKCDRPRIGFAVCRWRWGPWPPRPPPLQEFRPLARGVQDDLEMAITLLAGAAVPQVCCWTPTCASGRRRPCWRNMSRRWPGFGRRRRLCAPSSASACEDRVRHSAEFGLSGL